MAERTVVYIAINPCSTRLGNWLFQYAAAKSIAKDGEVKFVVSGDQDVGAIKKYDELFGGVECVREAPVGVKVLKGLFQNTKYLDEKVVMGLFKCPPRVEAKIVEKYGVLCERPNLVSIHVRRGDYLALPHRHPFVGEKYLYEAICRFPGAEFVVCSDDIPWCKRFFLSRRFPGIVFHFIEGNEVLVDFFIAAKCSNHICSNSSFSWWSAYLNRKGKTIFPSMWYGPAARTKDWSGLYFDGSEVIENGYSLALWLKARVCMLKNRCGGVLRRIGLKRNETHQLSYIGLF